MTVEGRRSKAPKAERNPKAENRTGGTKWSSGGGPSCRIGSQRRSEQAPEHATSSVEGRNPASERSEVGRRLGIEQWPEMVRTVWDRRDARWLGLQYSDP